MARDDDAWLRDRLGRELGPMPGAADGDDGWSTIVDRSVARRRRQQVLAATVTSVVVILVVAAVTFNRPATRDELVAGTPPPATDEPTRVYPSPANPVRVRATGSFTEGGGAPLRFCPNLTDEPAAGCLETALPSTTTVPLGGRTPRADGAQVSDPYTVEAEFDGRRLAIDRMHLPLDPWPAPSEVLAPGVTSPPSPTGDKAALCRTIEAAYEAALPGLYVECTELEGGGVGVSATYVDEQMLAAWQALAPGMPLRAWTQLRRAR